eukprot:216530-Rhodomonas_salina.4
MARERVVSERAARESEKGGREREIERERGRVGDLGEAVDVRGDEGAAESLSLRDHQRQHLVLRADHTSVSAGGGGGCGGGGGWLVG